ncbi:MAG TPA: MBL fold metallo-hydrolase [Albidovulum sp.]|uniref:MBL fold metallo-hydrolase n=1 Tax=Albidovulum sp. TaxID=1872424 RepID=UPI002C680283|nr:MBL fold metallo-hydrolase [Albidovulum sp.]
MPSPSNMPAPVDRIEVLVLIDNKTDSLSTVPANFVNEWQNLKEAGMEQLSGSCQCCANHGLALIVRAWRGEQQHTMLFDAGPVDFAVEYNGSRLGADFGEIDAITLSHGHWDHAGGLPEAIRLIRKDRPGGLLPIYLHPDMFRQRALPLSGGQLMPIREIPSPVELLRLGAEPHQTKKPVWALDDMFYVSAEIPRTTAYEGGFPGHMRRTLDGADWEDDPLIMDERFLAVNIAGKGVVVFTACSHAGVVNVMNAAQSNFPDVPIHALMGGYHLSGANEKIIEQTVIDLGGFDIDLILPGHCTGWRATNALERSFGLKVVPMAVGMKISL